MKDANFIVFFSVIRKKIINFRASRYGLLVKSSSKVIYRNTYHSSKMFVSQCRRWQVRKWRVLFLTKSQNTGTVKIATRLGPCLTHLGPRSITVETVLGGTKLLDDQGPVRILILSMFSGLKKASNSLKYLLFFKQKCNVLEILEVSSHLHSWLGHSLELVPDLKFHAFWLDKSLRKFKKMLGDVFISDLS